DAVSVELNVVECIGFEQFAEAEDGELVLSTSNGHTAVAFKLLIAPRIVGDYGLLEPADTLGLDEGEHALGVVVGPAHVGAGPQVNPVSNALADITDELDFLHHPLTANERSPAEAKFHRFVAFVFVL